jgi:DNA (cytosine-5)-methyltransferase 1
MSRSSQSQKAGTRPRRPTVVDLFSGAGGLSLGCEQAGMDVLASLEYDPIATAVHQFNFPRTEVLCADAATITGETIKDAAARGWKAHGHEDEWDGRLDAVVGGPPCQGFSLIGKRAFDDPRNQLVFSFARLVGALKPRYFVMENVPGIRSVKAGESADAPLLLDLLIEEFVAYGYKVGAPLVLNAYNFGVPQDRSRTILTGWLTGEVPPKTPANETRGRSRSGGAHRLPEHLPDCPSVRDAIGDLPNLDDFDDSSLSDEIRLTEAQLLAATDSAGSYARVLRGIDPDPTDHSYLRTWSPRTLTSSFRTVHAEAVAKRYAATTAGRTEGVSRFLRLHPDGVSPTLRAGTHYERGSFNAPRPIHYEYPRVVSVREAARLHSFPDWFRLHWTKWHGFREVGNALPPKLARAVMAEIVSALGVKPLTPSTRLDLGDLSLLYLENVAAAKHFAADVSRIPRNALRTRDHNLVSAGGAEAA